MMSDEELLELDIDALSDEKALDISLSVLDKEKENYGRRTLKTGIGFAVLLLAYVLMMALEWKFGEYAVMGIGAVAGTWMFDSLQIWLKIPGICRKLRKGTYKMTAKEYLRYVKRSIEKQKSDLEKYRKKN